MALKVKRFILWYHYEPEPQEFVLDYTPVATDGSEQEQLLKVYKTQLRVRTDGIPPALQGLTRGILSARGKAIGRDGCS